nr:hypothetical protein [Tanacetum cinerariifolium]
MSGMTTCSPQSSWNSNAYKEYYAITTGAAPPKPKASTHISQASGSSADEGNGSIPGVLDVPTDESEEELSWNSTDDEGADDEGKDGDDDDADKDEEPSAGPDQGSKRRRKGKKPESASAPIETATRSSGRLTQGLNLDRHRQASLLLQMSLCRPPVNPEGQQYPHNLLKPLPLIPNNQGRRVIPFEHFINNDLEYLCRGASSQKYTTSITKTKAADYVHIKWIEDLVPRTMWIEEPIGYHKHALWEVSHWRCKRQQFYGFAVNQESTRDVYSKRRIIAITELKIVEWHNYKHLDWITVRRDDDKLYKFKEADFKRLRIQDIEDMLLLLLQGKLTNLTVEECFAFNVSL